MDPLAESKDAGTQTTTNPLMPPAKQQRILIWRTEVASALFLPAPSLASSHSDESADSSSAAASPGPGPGPVTGPSSPSRPRGFWKRLSWRFSSRHRDDPAASPDAERTSMYREDRPRKGTGSHHVDDEDEGGLPDKISDDGAGNGLRDKQERLQRAARLLNKGIREDEGATAIKAHRSRNGHQHSLA